MARLTSIASEIATKCATITTTNGYSANIGSINVEDEALQTYPSVDITYDSEEAAPSPHDIYSYADVEFQIVIRAKCAANVAQPKKSVDEQLDNTLADLKKLFYVTLGNTLALTYNPVITYKGFTKEKYKSGDAFVAGAITSKWNVRYQNNLTS
jgi:hypothetical protein